MTHDTSHYGIKGSVIEILRKEISKIPGCSFLEGERQVSANTKSASYSLYLEGWSPTLHRLRDYFSVVTYAAQPIVNLDPEVEAAKILEGLKPHLDQQYLRFKTAVRSGLKKPRIATGKHLSEIKDLMINKAVLLTIIDEYASDSIEVALRNTILTEHFLLHEKSDGNFNDNKPFNTLSRESENGEWVSISRTIKEQSFDEKEQYSYDLEMDIGPKVGKAQVERFLKNTDLEKIVRKLEGRRQRYSYNRITIYCDQIPETIAASAVGRPLRSLVEINPHFDDQIIAGIDSGNMRTKILIEPEYIRIGDFMDQHCIEYA